MIHMHIYINIYINIYIYIYNIYIYIYVLNKKTHFYSSQKTRQITYKVLKFCRSKMSVM